MDNYPAPVQKTEVTLDDIWAAISIMSNTAGTWNGAGLSDLNRYFIRNETSFDVLCNVVGSSPTYNEVSNCTIYPSSDEDKTEWFRTFTIHTNARIEINYRGGGNISKPLDTVEKAAKILSKILEPSLRPPILLPQPVVIQKIDLSDKCTSLDHILDFLTYYEIKFNRDAFTKNVILYTTGKLRYKVIINAFTPTRAGDIEPSVTTEESVPPRSFEFQTGRGLISALGNVRIQVNEDIDDFRVVTRIKDPLPFGSQFNEHFKAIHTTLIRFDQWFEP